MINTSFIVPAMTSTLSGIADNANPIITEFLPWALLILGVIVGFGLLGWVIRHFTHGVNS